MSTTAPFEFITKWTAKNYTEAKDCPAVFGWPRIIGSYTFHHWGLESNYNYPGAFEDVSGYLASPNSRQVSANETGEAGRVACLIDYADASWANGNARGNAQSITGEWNPRCSRADRKTAAKRIAMLWAVYGEFPLHGHNYWTATACPGKYEPHKIQRAARRVRLTAGDIKEIETETGKKAKPKPERKPKKRQKPAPKRGLYWTVEKGDTLSKIADYYAVTVQELARHNRIKNPNRIHVGQHIRIPGPLYWTVRAGDSIEAIADYYGMGYDAVAKNAGLVGKRPIIGTTIRVY